MKSKLLFVSAMLLISLNGLAQGMGSGAWVGHQPPPSNGSGAWVGGGSSYQDYSGAIGAGDYCSTCAFENRLDVPNNAGKNRFLVNNDRISIDARCQELGWDYGVALERYSHEEWCRYKNARTRTWDRRNRQWMFGACTVGNVKMARCYRR